MAREDEGKAIKTGGAHRLRDKRTSEPAVGQRIVEGLKGFANDPFWAISRRKVRLKECKASERILWPAWAWCGAPGVTTGGLEHIWKITYVFAPVTQEAKP